MKNIPYNILLVTSFYVNSNKSHKYENKYDLYKIAQKTKTWTLDVLRFFKGFFEAIFQPWYTGQRGGATVYC